MPDYAAQIQPRDRWAIVSYVRALQLSQQASIQDVPEEIRGQFRPAPSATAPPATAPPAQGGAK
jgi:hypothetical protein